MDEPKFDDLEIASPAVVMEAARNFAEALSETPQFAAFEQAAHAFRRNTAAQAAMAAFQAKQQELQGLAMLNALDAGQQTELNRLQQAFVDQRVVQAYFKAQGELAALCQVLGDELSAAIGMNYAAVCGPSCCG